MQAAGKEIVVQLTQNLSLPKTKKSHAEDIQWSINNHIDKVLKEFLSNNSFKTHCFLLSPATIAAPFLTIFKEISSPERIQEIQTLAQNCWKKRLEWIEKYQN